MIGIVLIIILVFLYCYYEPYIDITDTTIILWYGSKEKRNYKVLWSKNNKENDY